VKLLDTVYSAAAPVSHSPEGASVGKEPQLPEDVMSRYNSFDTSRGDTKSGNCEGVEEDVPAPRLSDPSSIPYDEIPVGRWAELLCAIVIGSTHRFVVKCT